MSELVCVCVGVFVCLCACVCACGGREHSSSRVMTDVMNKNSSWSCRWLVMPERIRRYLHINFFKLLNTYPPVSVLLSLLLLLLWYHHYHYYHNHHPAQNIDILLVIITIHNQSLYSLQEQIGCRLHVSACKPFCDQPMFQQRLLNVVKHAEVDQRFLVGQAQGERSESPSSRHKRVCLCVHVCVGICLCGCKTDQRMRLSTRAMEGTKETFPLTF